MDIFKRFTYLRSQKRLNKSAFARFLGITPSEVGDIEHGVIKPSTRILTRLAERQDVNVSWLLTGKGSPFLSENPEKKDEKTEKPAIVLDLEGIIKETTNPRFAELEEALNQIKEVLAGLEL